MAEGIGPLHLAILRSLASGETASTDSLKRLANQTTGGEQLVKVLNRMESRHWLRRNPVGWQITDSGKRVLDPSTPVLPAMRPYKAPPAPPRRADSDYTVYPSRYGDVLQQYERHL